MKCLFLILAVLALGAASAQPGREADIRFIVEKLRTTYAGYGDKVNEDDWQQLVKLVRKSKSKDSFFVLSRLTGYFRDDHVALFTAMKTDAADSGEALNNLKLIRQAHPLQAMLDDPGSGYWLDDQGYQVLYIRQTGPDRWEGDIAESRDSVLLGLRVLVLYRQKEGGWLSDYTDVGTGDRMIVPVNFKTPGVMIGRSFFKYRQVRGYQPGTLSSITPFNFEPSVNRLDSQTLVVHMPHFDQSYLGFYDSLVKANVGALGQVATLILDIRGNPGGSLRCMAPLMPYVCDGPIQGVDFYKRCSDDAIAEARSELLLYTKRGDSVRMGRLQWYIDSLVRYKGQFLFLPGVDSSCTTVDNSIRHIAILMDHGSRSAAELMVLCLRQGAKVKLFGEASGGAVDYADLIRYELPQSHFKLWVATSKRVLTTWDPAYDETGIPPNVEIPDTESDWIGFVQKYYQRF